ncbi:MAG: nucleotidyltransferase domain-containing protein [Clostridiales bacterium]|nr:nucleotidyltransferase domain-containing protein [Clostridiales bacterium]
MTLRELRKQKGLTQSECAKYLGVPVRTYQNYETAAAKQNTIKYQYMMQKLSELGFIDETHGILSVRTISDVCSEVFPEYGVEYGYLFGSYAKGTPGESSDVDILISTSASGLKFYELAEVLREKLRKNVDLLGKEQLKGNEELLNEILKYGIKIYG